MDNDLAPPRPDLAPLAWGEVPRPSSPLLQGGRGRGRPRAHTRGNGANRVSKSFASPSMPLFMRARGARQNSPF